MSCRIGEKKVRKLIEKTGLPIVAALTRGGTDHRIDLCLEDGSVMSLHKDGTIEKSQFRHNMVKTAEASEA